MENIYHINNNNNKNESEFKYFSLVTFHFLCLLFWMKYNNIQSNFVLKHWSSLFWVLRGMISKKSEATLCHNGTKFLGNTLFLLVFYLYN